MNNIEIDEKEKKSRKILYIYLILVILTSVVCCYIFYEDLNDSNDQKKTTFVDEFGNVCRETKNSNRCYLYNSDTFDVEYEYLQANKFKYFINGFALFEGKSSDEITIKNIIDDNYVLILCKENDTEDYRLYNNLGKEVVDFNKINKLGFISEIKVENDRIYVNSEYELDDMDRNKLCGYKKSDEIVFVEQEMLYKNGKFSDPTTINEMTYSEYLALYEVYCEE